MEKPLIDQLTGMGWTHPGRREAGQRQVTGRLRSQIYALNRDKHGKPWLDEQRIDQTLSALVRVVYGLLAEETASDGVIAAEQGQRLTDFARRLHGLARRQTTRRDFWRHPVDQYGNIRHHDHGSTFWRTVERAMPDASARRTRLRLSGYGLWLPESPVA